MLTIPTLYYTIVVSIFKFYTLDIFSAGCFFLLAVSKKGANQQLVDSATVKW